MAKEFEDAFPYEETPDQLKAIAEIKADMENLFLWIDFYVVM